MVRPTRSDFWKAPLVWGTLRMVSLCSLSLIFPTGIPYLPYGSPPLLPFPPRGMTFALVKVFIENNGLLRGLFTVGNLYYCHGY